MIEFECQTRMGVMRGNMWGNESAPVVLALHGWLDNCESFAQFNSAEFPFCMVALDLPGHGKSDWLGAGAEYAIWSSLAPIIDVLDTHPIFLNKNIHVLGHSMGGAIGVLLSSVLATRVTSFTALDSFGPYTNPASNVATHLRQALLEPIPTAGRVYHSLEDALTTRVKNSRGASRECLKAIVERNLVSVANNQYRWRTDPRLRMSSTVRLTEDQLEPILKTLTMPVLVLRAEHGIMPIAVLEDRLVHVSNATLETLEGHHHFHVESDTALQIVKRVSAFIHETSNA